MSTSARASKGASTSWSGGGFLDKPATHEADSAQSPISTMDHHVLHVHRDHRVSVLVDLTSAPGRTVVFTRTKHGAKNLARQLNSRGVPTVELHGNLAQNARTRNMEAFHSGKASTLVATDIAARGIHVDDVALVIHADPPAEHKAYLHRSGRTARAGAAGTVITLMTDQQVKDVRDLTRAAKISPTTTKVSGPNHPMLQQLAPGERVLVAGGLVDDRPSAPAERWRWWRPSSQRRWRRWTDAAPAAPAGRRARVVGGQSRSGGQGRSRGPRRLGCRRLLGRQPQRGVVQQSSRPLRPTRLAGRVAGLVAMEVLTPRDVPLGGLRAMTVRRTLPQRQRSLIGAWCFVDHYGPDEVDASSGMVVPPHPHTGLQTVSWLFTGEIEHRDSAGHHAFVRPGELNLMTAGRGISHSEYSTPDTTTLHGAQLWLALPDGDRQVEPTFEHFAPDPVVGDGLGGPGLHRLAARLDVARDDVQPVARSGAHAGGRVRRCGCPVDSSYELGVLVDTGAVRVDGKPLAAHELGFVEPGAETARATADEDTRLLVLGGPPFGEQIVMWWNFIGREHDEVVGYRAQWEALLADGRPRPVRPARGRPARGAARSAAAERPDGQARSLVVTPTA